MPRLWIWLQLVIGWFPVWALYAALIVTAHPPITPAAAAVLALRAIIPAALLGLLVHRFTRRLPWPRPFRLSFLLVHAVAATTYSLTWLTLASVSEIVMHGTGAFALGRMFVPFAVLGIWLYVMVAGVSYAAQATDRAVVAEASAARAQLAALRAQLHPHFLFNALHTVVQLIPQDPRRAADAAEGVAGLLRTALEEDRDLVTLREELAFVQRYLEIERIRFGDRLQVITDVDDETLRVLVPSFALQTLVENAVQHGAAPRIEQTTVRISAVMRGQDMQLRVSDDGVGSQTANSTLDRRHDAAVLSRTGTGLQRLGERLSALYGGRARLRAAPQRPAGFEAEIELRGALESVA